MPTLHWLDRDNTLKTTPQVPCRILREQARLSYGDPDSDNMLIQGDNLHALKALLPYYRAQVKCIFIDPPYNTKSAFEHYPDNLEHSQWLDMMFPRLELLRELLAEDGSMWITIDDHEAHYLKVIMDEVFGRGNFVRNIVWQKKYTVASDSRGIPDSHDHILVYRKSDTMQRGLLPRTDKQNSLYKYDDKDGLGLYRTDNLSVKTYSEDYDYEIINPKTGKGYFPPQGRCWMTSKERVEKLISEHRIFFGKNGNGAPQLKRYLNEVQQGVVPTSWWPYDEVGHNDESRKEIKKLGEDDFFSTPKPERLIKRILEIATNENDLVLDSFLGSGTTAAVAHKMQRRYIGIEMGEHAQTHCAIRLKKVIDGEQGGISKAMNWQGGGGFKFYTLGAELFTAQGWIHPEVKFADLAAYLWFKQTHTPYKGKADTPLLGIHQNTAYYLLYNGIMNDKSATGGNILTHAMLEQLEKNHPTTAPQRIIFANGCRLGEKALLAGNITFQLIPWAI